MSDLEKYKRELTVLLSKEFPKIYIIEKWHNDHPDGWRIRFFIFTDSEEGIEHYNVTDFVMRVMSLSDLRHEMDDDFLSLRNINRIIHNRGEIHGEEYDHGLDLNAQSGFYILETISRELYGDKNKLTGVAFS